MRIPRNDLCPCGSGKKYKTCHGKTSARGSVFGFDSDALQKLEAMQQQRINHREKYGHVKEVIHVDHMGKKFVAVGNALHVSEHWKTFPDFLRDYVKIVFGKNWWRNECALPESERHVVVQWCFQLHRQLKSKERAANGFFPITMDGPTTANLLLGYDLYVLSHHSALQNRIVQRLKRRDQFQGARYELFVAATMIRAGYKIHFEDESDPSSRHPEFFAEHPVSKEKIAIEAKCRHRPGILGMAGIRQPIENLKIGLHRELNKAALKAGDYPLIAFVELNLPKERLRIDDASWQGEIRESISQIGVGSLGKWPFAHIIVSNLPHHYGLETQPDPNRLFYVSDLINPKNSIKTPDVIAGIEDSLHRYKNCPTDFPEDFRQPVK